MPKFIEGKLDAKGLKFGIIVGRFNSFISERLLEGALDAIIRHGGDDKHIDVARVPGSFEIPLAAKKMVETGRYDALICLGAVIRGATPHFDYVSAEVSKGVAHVSLDSGVPVAFGVLTTDTIEQAVERAGTKAGNKGFDAAMTAIETANLFRGAQVVGVRRQARELALQALYSLDVNHSQVAESLAAFWDNFNPSLDVRTFAEELINGYLANHLTIDAQIEENSKNWTIYRMAKVDLNILRLAVYELLYRPDIPKNVTINEAIEIAKKFGADESPAFVNGILDEFATRLTDKD